MFCEYCGHNLLGDNKGYCHHCELKIKGITEEDFKIAVILKKETPQPEKKHKIYVGKKYKVLKPKYSDIEFGTFKPDENHIFVKTEAGRIKLKKSEYKILEKK